MNDDLTPEQKFERSWNSYRTRIAKDVNAAMRKRYLASDANLGTGMLKDRNKGNSSANLFVLRQEWKPISMDGDGLNFEISELSMRSLGQSALDPEIDEMVIDAAYEALVDNHDDVLVDLIQDLIDGGSDKYEIIEEQR